MEKSTVADIFKKKPYTAVGAFAAAAFIMILVGVFGLRTPVVAMCVLVIIETGIAVMLHNAELWVHGILILAEVIAGILAGRIGLIFLCVLVYAAATAALQIPGGKEQ